MQLPWSSAACSSVMPVSLGSNHFICLSLSPKFLYTLLSLPNPLNAGTSPKSALILVSSSYAFCCPWTVLPTPITSAPPSTALTSTSLPPDPVVCVRTPDITLSAFLLHKLNRQIRWILPPSLAPLPLPSFPSPCHSSSPGFHLDSCNCLLLLASALIPSSSSGWWGINML